MEQLIYFASAHTSTGYQDLIATNLSDLKHVFFIEGATSQERSACIRMFFEKWRARGDKLELLLNSLDYTIMSGVINRRLSCALIDRTQHLDYQMQALGSIEHIINLNTSLMVESRTEQEDILMFQLCKEKAIEQAHHAFNLGRQIHDELEKIFINAMDFNKADQVADQLIEDIFKQKLSETDVPVTRRRFLGASTANGVVDYVDLLTEHLEKRYLIKGRAGSGKSTLLRKIVSEAEKLNYSLEVYHCGFDPKSLDMVIIRELGIAIFDSTSPHKYEPSRHGDQIVDLYETTISPGTDEKYQTPIFQLTRSYKIEIEEGIAKLDKALELTRKIEAINQKSLDSNLLRQQIDHISERIEQAVTS